jgi:hypothetical protein
MKAVSIFLLSWALMAISASPVMAQDSLGDLVAQGGFDWLIGRWAASTEDGQEIVFEQKWALDRHAIIADFAMGDLRYHGMILFVPYREEVIQVGADNRGGTWEGTWRDEYGSAALRMGQEQPNGQTREMEIVYTRVDADTMKAAMYSIDSSGYRGSQPQATLTYKRRKAEAAEAQSAGSNAGWSERVTLGDLLSQYGYEWMIGQWRTRNEQSDMDIDIQYKWALDKNAVLVEAKTDQFEYIGMITLAPSGEEVVQTGADNKGGIWKSTWSEGYDGAVNRHEMRRPDGTTEKMEHVYSKIDKDSFKIAEYAVESGGYRASSPRGETVFKRRAGEASQK